MKKYPHLLALLLLTTACGTSYHEKDLFGNGFSEINTGEDSFIVNFQGNTYSDNDKMMQYALKRASELTLAKGYKYFSVVSENNLSKVKISNSTISTRPGISVQIKCYREKTPEPNLIDASYYLAHNK
jgi:hypothetical protein